MEICKLFLHFYFYNIVLWMVHSPLPMPFIVGHVACSGRVDADHVAVVEFAQPVRNIVSAHSHTGRG